RASRAAYYWLLRRAPGVWALAYGLGDRMGPESPLSFGMTRVGTARLARLLDTMQPDAVITVHATPAVAMATLALTGRRLPPHTTAVTDFVAHSQWMPRPVDRYCVAAEEVRNEFVARGIPPERVLVTGEPVREGKLIKANGSGFMAAILPSGMRAISTEISPETGAGGFILPNDHVDVILSRRDRAAEKSAGIEVHTSEVILSNVRVLAIDQTVEEEIEESVVVGKTATLELAQRQAETLALSRQLGTLTLALRSLVDAQGDKDDANADDRGRRNGVNIVRFGVTTTMTPK
ncbi:MAG: Flp pilus assembly protein CpaB, partial [Burkholderiales bacterium]